jgi:hypothetical protein
MPVVVCEHCRSSVEVGLEHLDAEVQCGQCGRAFVAKENRADSPKFDPGYDDAGEPRPRRRSRYVEDEFDQYPEETLVEARAMARGPGLALMCVNSISLLLVVIGVAFMVIVLMNVPAGPGGRGGGVGGPELIIIGFYGIYGLIAVAKMVLGFFGGRALIRLGSYGWAMAGAIATVVPLDGCLSLIFVPFGVWALVMLQKPEVKWAMRRNAKRES